MPTFPLSLPAIRVRQPLGEFYAFTIDAETLRLITFLDPTRVESVDRKTFWYSLLGAQRPSSKRRAKQIATYIDTVESAFPNSIILAANYINYGELQEDEQKRWKIETTGRSLPHLIIPSGEKMASIIDGQHRLLGFDFCAPERRSMELLCAVYMDLPQAYQAFLFATININQRKVDKSLAYDQFGYNLDQENGNGWAPDKLAVSITRKLNLDPKSPLYNRIKIAPLNSELVFPNDAPSDWKVSTACIVEGVIGLISANPRGDRDMLHKQPLSGRRRSALPSDASPLRQLYLDSDDPKLYGEIASYFRLADNLLWSKATASSYIRKTVGVQALFDVFRAVATRFGAERVNVEAARILAESSSVDFSDIMYQASGRGRVMVKNTLLLYGDLIDITDVSEMDRVHYVELQQRYPKRR